MDTNTSEQTRLEQKPMTEEKIQSLMQSKSSMAPAKTWRAPSAGILAIVAGYFNILLGWVGLMGGLTGATLLGLASVSSGVGTGIGVILLVLGAISVIGGLFTLSRRAYGLGVIGSIAALFPSPALILGTLSLVFVGLARNEFHR